MPDMRRWLAAFAPAVLVCALDRITKIAVERDLALYETRAIVPGFFNLVHSRNQGAAFGMFAESASAWRTVLLVGITGAVLGVVAVMLARMVAGKTYGGAASRWGLSLVLGGALGNFYDRLTQGMVTDFLEFYAGRFVWPAFNVADAAITVGAFLVALEMWRSKDASGAKCIRN
jgi:signal peptidase II